MNNKITVINEKGKKIEYEVLFTFESDETERNYIVYTDNKKDKNDNTKDEQILSTSNECWNGYIFNFPVFILEPGHIFTSNYFGFWGTQSECEIMKEFFESQEFNVLLSMIKQTQNFNSNYFWCIPLVTTKEQLEYIQSEMKKYSNFIATFEHEVRRPYIKRI